MKKKIAFFTGYFLPHLGGIERYVDKLSEQLIEKDYEVIIVTTNEANHLSQEGNKKRKILRLEIYELFKNRYPIPKYSKHNNELLDTVLQQSPDFYIVNTRFHLTSLIGARLAAKNNKPVVLIEHGTSHFTVNNIVLDFFGKIYEHALTSYLDRFVTRYYGVSKKCNQWLKHYHIKASGVFYNSVDPLDAQKVDDSYAGKFDDNDIVITFASRWIKEKGLSNLMQAYSDIRKKNISSPIKLVVAGGGPLESDVKRFSEQDDSVIVLGHVPADKMASLLKRTDIFVHPSLYPEGLPTSILEAGLMKCAVIATPRGGTEEVIVTDRHGIITDGTAADIEEKLEYLISNNSEREIMGENIHCRIVDEFSWQKTADKVIDSIKKDR